MTVDLSMLDGAPRLLFEIQLRPLQGNRFQSTGFPNLGAATFQTASGTSLLVESAQSMANRMEVTIWDEAKQDVKEDVVGISHVRVLRAGKFLTDSVLEAHRLNSPYIEKSTPHSDKDPQLHSSIEAAIFPGDSPLLDRGELAKVLLKYDVGSLLHGVFLESIDGRIRVARALSAFIEADDVQTAASGGVKNDHVNPSGTAKDGFGNVPFARDEFSATRTILYVNLDLSQIRGYRLGSEIERLLILLSLYKLRALLDTGLRLRTACEFVVIGPEITARAPDVFSLPPIDAIRGALKQQIAKTVSQMVVSQVNYDSPLAKAKEGSSDGGDSDPALNAGDSTEQG